MYRPCLIVLSIVFSLFLSFVGLAEERGAVEETKEAATSEPKPSAEATGESEEKAEDAAEEKAEEKGDENTAEAAEDKAEVSDEEKTTPADSSQDAEPSASKSKETSASEAVERETAEADTSSDVDSATPEKDQTPETPSDEMGSDEASRDASQPAPAIEKKTPEAEDVEESKPKIKRSPGKYRRMITAGVGVPLCGFAREGIIEGKGCINTSSNFLWGNLDLRFHIRLSEKFSIGGGLLQSFIYFDEVGLMGGHLVADFRWYAVPDYLYFKMDLFFGFPMFFALGPAMGHSFSVNEKIHVFIENQFIFMAVAGVYGFWQPTVGVSTRF